MDCARRIFDKAGVTDYVQFKVTDLAIEEVKALRATQDQIDRAIAKPRELAVQV